MTHYDEEALFEYVEGTSPIAGDIESHVSSCDQCSMEVGEQREMIATLSSAEVWNTPPPPPRQFVVNVASFAERARREEAAAIELCDEILTGPAAWWQQRMRQSGKAFTAGMVRQLLERMRSTLRISPTNALQITALAIEVANALDVAEYPCDYVISLRAQACRDHAYVLSFMGRYPEALEFTEHSKRLFGQVPMPEYDLARLALVKASILRSIDRVEEALVLIRAAGDTFLRFGDRSRFLVARQTEASTLYRRGSIEAALAIWKDVEAAGLQTDELESTRLAHNIALCYSDLGRPEDAIPYIQGCIVEFEMLGVETERTRSRWLLGHALAGCGKYQEAIPILRQTWREFEQLDIIAESGLVALELAESLLVLGRSEEVPAICRDVIGQFTRAGMASRALTALSFLREAVAMGQGSPSLVQHVSAFLRQLPAEQPRLFAPPPAGLE
ncbi:MAG TPA: tetratricopeptide repeat protein [Thermoanaerobaculia bacterium]|jgi:tetratricopeptide (TPR) repeat protein|nr:tetratricopeptide repeat protein [Thermoanaerobaculia bacterium]